MKLDKYYVYVYAADQKSRNFVRDGSRIVKLVYHSDGPDYVFEEAVRWLKWHYSNVGKVRIVVSLIDEFGKADRWEKELELTKTCEDCSHCEAKTCASKPEAETHRGSIYVYMYDYDPDKQAIGSKAAASVLRYPNSDIHSVVEMAKGWIEEYLDTSKCYWLKVTKANGKEFFTTVVYNDLEEGPIEVETPDEAEVEKVPAEDFFSGADEEVETPAEAETSKPIDYTPILEKILKALYAIDDKLESIKWRIH